MRQATITWDICSDCSKPIFWHEAGRHWFSNRPDGSTTFFCNTIGGHIPGGQIPSGREDLEVWLDG